MIIELDEPLRLLIQKLTQCQDSKTGDRLFFGVIRVVFDREGQARLFVEETTWETESGDKIDTNALRGENRA